MATIFRGVPAVDYVSGDLDPGKAEVTLDVTDIEYADDSFDVIYCSHVLEHVTEDVKALREFNRVLRPGGWAILQVPIHGAMTYEDPTITDPADRLRHFGQHDHVRVYGLDYQERLIDAGFAVTVDGFVRGLSVDETTRLGLMRDEDVYLCEKRERSQ